MKVIVYVEGPSDQNALKALLKPVIEVGRHNGVGISFSPQEGKAPILKAVPRRAADYLKQNPKDWVFVLPDLYPMASYDNSEERHRSFDDLFALIRGRFEARADKIALAEDALSHFRIHCLKHDLEALLLAATDTLRLRLDTKHDLREHWRRPVEDQNDNRPPKRVVEDLFKRYRKNSKYIDTVDAVWILARASLADVEKECSQRFAPFVRELRTIAEGKDPTKLSSASN